LAPYPILTKPDFKVPQPSKRRLPLRAKTRYFYFKRRVFSAHFALDPHPMRVNGKGKKSPSSNGGRPGCVMGRTFVVAQLS
jgi:hypothetical protein